MNILHICLSHGFGGLEMYPLRVGKEMKALGHQVFGLTFQGSEIAEVMQREFDASWELETRGNGYMQLFKLADWMKQHQIQYVHCHKSSDLLLAVLLKKLCGFKLIYTDHMGVKKPKKDIFHRFIYRNVDQLLSISQFTLAHNKKALPVKEGCIQALWLGTDISELPTEKADLKAELKLAPETFMIGIVGRLSPGKGHFELLQAMTHLDERFHLVVVGGLNAKQGGDDPYIAKLKTYVADHEIASKVTFYGFSSTPEKQLSGMDVVAIPSHLEAFGLTVIEAMAQGKAIIGANTGAIPEIIDNTGVLVDPLNVEALAAAMSDLSLDQARREALAKAARERAEQQFDQKVHVRKLLSIYQML
ncbi:MAG: glycosyltransferase family 1 protein [Marinomonas sp.]|nr:MAG: glycosyltransferase family 1 protein [Marinomonas sp.]